MKFPQQSQISVVFIDWSTIWIDIVSGNSRSLSEQTYVSLLGKTFLHSDDLVKACLSYEISDLLAQVIDTLCIWVFSSEEQLVVGDRGFSASCKAQDLVCKCSVVCIFYPSAVHIGVFLLNHCTVCGAVTVSMSFLLPRWTQHANLRAYA